MKRFKIHLQPQSVINENSDLKFILNLSYNVYKYTYENPESLLEKIDSSLHFPPNVLAYLRGQYPQKQEFEKTVQRLIQSTLEWKDRDTEVELFSLFLNQHDSMETIVFFLEVWGRLYTHNHHLIGSAASEHVHFLRERRLSVSICEKLSKYIFDDEMIPHIQNGFYLPKKKTSSRKLVVSVVYLRFAMREYFRVRQVLNPTVESPKNVLEEHENVRSAFDNLSRELEAEEPVEEPVYDIPVDDQTVELEEEPRTASIPVTPSPLHQSVTPSSPISPFTQEENIGTPISARSDARTLFYRMQLQLQELQTTQQGILERVKQVTFDRSELVNQCAKASTDAVSKSRDQIVTAVEDHLGAKIGSRIDELSEVVYGVGPELKKRVHVDVFQAKLGDVADKIMGVFESINTENINNITKRFSALEKRLASVESDDLNLSPTRPSPDLSDVQKRLSVLENAFPTVDSEEIFSDLQIEVENCVAAHINKIDFSAFMPSIPATSVPVHRDEESSIKKNVISSDVIAEIKGQVAAEMGDRIKEQILEEIKADLIDEMKKNIEEVKENIGTATNNQLNEVKATLMQTIRESMPSTPKKQAKTIDTETTTLLMQTIQQFASRIEELEATVEKQNREPTSVPVEIIRDTGKADIEIQSNIEDLNEKYDSVTQKISELDESLKSSFQNVVEESQQTLRGEIDGVLSKTQDLIESVSSSIVARVEASCSERIVGAERAIAEVEDRMTLAEKPQPFVSPDELALVVDHIDELRNTTEIVKTTNDIVSVRLDDICGLFEKRMKEFENSNGRLMNTSLDHVNELRGLLDFNGALMEHLTALSTDVDNFKNDTSTKLSDVRISLDAITDQLLYTVEDLHKTKTFGFSTPNHPMEDSIADLTTPNEVIQPPVIEEPIESHLSRVLDETRLIDERELDVLGEELTLTKKLLSSQLESLMSDVQIIKNNGPLM
ncbi:hypothetical protein PCE1_002689 [Barthelona sp. PCE]